MQTWCFKLIQKQHIVISLSTQYIMQVPIRLWSILLTFLLGSIGAGPAAIHRGAAVLQTKVSPEGGTLPDVNTHMLNA